jgi:hypothetical protein
MLEPAPHLRENAARCLRLSKSVNSPGDIAFLEALAAKFIHEAEQREAAEAGTAGHVVSATSDGARDVSPRYDPNLPAVRSSVPISRDTKPAYVSSDRRRPGRRDNVSPALTPLLREESSQRLPVESADDRSDNLRSARGIIIWVVVSAAIWLLLLLWVGLGSAP